MTIYFFIFCNVQLILLKFLPRQDLTFAFCLFTFVCSAELLLFSSFWWLRKHILSPLPSNHITPWTDHVSSLNDTIWRGKNVNLQHSIYNKYSDGIMVCCTTVPPFFKRAQCFLLFMPCIGSQCHPHGLTVSSRTRRRLYPVCHLIKSTCIVKKKTFNRNISSSTTWNYRSNHCFAHKARGKITAQMLIWSLQTRNKCSYKDRFISAWDERVTNSSIHSI